jgi:predicted NAD/FAD-dependent oxidoreductase
VGPWASGFRLQNGTLKSDDQMRYVGTTGMTSIAKNLPIRLETRIVGLKVQGSAWPATKEAGDRSIALTTSVPQSIALSN